MSMLAVEANPTRGGAGQGGRREADVVGKKRRKKREARGKEKKDKKRSNSRRSISITR
jgi:hypothetical protein